MRIIISPAKKMNVEDDSLQPLGLPVFLDETREIMDWIKSLSLLEAQKLLGCNSRLAEQNSKCIENYLQPGDCLITCVFGEMSGDRVIQKGTYAKMARGEMVRFMAENQIDNPERLKEFQGLDYRYSPDLSGERNYVFVKKGRT